MKTSARTLLSIGIVAVAFGVVIWRTVDAGQPPSTPATVTSPTETVRASGTPGELTADDIAGSGNEIAREKAKNNTPFDVAALRTRLETATTNLDAALASLEGKPEFNEFKRLHELVEPLVEEYKSARKAGADATTLRGIAQRYADNVIAIVDSWDSPAFANLQNADYEHVDADWKAERYNRSSNRSTDPIAVARTKRIDDWRLLSRSRTEVSLYVHMDAREILRQRQQAGETIDANARRHEVLKASVVYLENRMR